MHFVITCNSSYLITWQLFMYEFDKIIQLLILNHKATDINATSINLGVEFMCDFCELVFTSKEKLENHVIAAHDEEFRSTQVSMIIAMNSVQSIFVPISLVYVPPLDSLL